MTVDSLLASAPLTLTRQIVEQTSQTIERVRETVDKVLLEGDTKDEQKVSQPGTQPVGASKESSEGGNQGHPDGDGDADDAGTKTPFRGIPIDTKA
ncbi:MAG TPA: hypothetical protein VGA19_05785 [Rhodospirillales bacterium]|jgi:hypothetical protein